MTHLNSKLVSVATIPAFPKSSARWMIARFNPGCANRAEGGLSALGYRVFIPKLTKFVTHARQRRVVMRPAMERYFWVEIDEALPLLGPLGGFQSAYSVRQCNGVESIIGPDLPTRRGPAQAEVWLKRQMEGDFDETKHGAFKVGDLVRAMAGEFEDRLGVIVNARKGRIDVKLVGTNVYRRMYSMNLRAA
jgi:transcription antitermination factor NusG